MIGNYDLRIFVKTRKVTGVPKKTFHPVFHKNDPLVRKKTSYWDTAYQNKQLWRTFLWNTGTFIFLNTLYLNWFSFIDPQSYYFCRFIHQNQRGFKHGKGFKKGFHVYECDEIGYKQKVDENFFSGSGNLLRFVFHRISLRDRVRLSVRHA